MYDINNGSAGVTGLADQNYTLFDNLVVTIQNCPPTNCITITCPTNDFVLYSCNSNCVVDPALFGSITVTNPCNPTNLIVSCSVPTNHCFPPGLTPVTLTAYAYGGLDSNYCTFYVDVLPSNCVPTNCCAGCAPPYPESYTVTVYPETNYLADDLCQGTNNTLADVLPSVPNGTVILFWDQTSQQFGVTDQFESGHWNNGSETLSPERALS